ncbi:dephospho-CoA kinase [Limosilactobacillus caecicola]|uniref:dephospho-CoA kinase n=1 Tax=Limosilactobacillus caecicola TaxID=2941332 RepID=UPI00203D8390|nr:dephospho-CoA kinase [Limosilactobacillus caecicola]
MTQIIGLTGGIATGKSTVSNYLRRQGYPIVDADQIARQVVEPGTSGLAKVVATFGNEILQSDGQLNRKKLGEIVFSDPAQLAKLNEILQPLIRAKIVRQLDELRNQQSPLIFLDAPLLFERHYQTTCDQVMVVATDPDTQLQRLMARDHMDQQTAQERITSQMPIQDKIDQADVVFDNNSSVAGLEEQVANWLRHVKKV